MLQFCCGSKIKKPNAVRKQVHGLFEFFGRAYLAFFHVVHEGVEDGCTLFVVDMQKKSALRERYFLMKEKWG
jgi:hypothetical protein